jgi:hypothetical protein
VQCCRCSPLGRQRHRGQRRRQWWLLAAHERTKAHPSGGVLRDSTVRLAFMLECAAVAAANGGTEEFSESLTRVAL